MDGQPLRLQRAPLLQHPVTPINTTHYLPQPVLPSAVDGDTLTAATNSPGREALASPRRKPTTQFSTLLPEVQVGRAGRNLGKDQTQRQAGRWAVRVGPVAA